MRVTGVVLAISLCTRLRELTDMGGVTVYMHTDRPDTTATSGAAKRCRGAKMSIPGVVTPLSLASLRRAALARRHSMVMLPCGWKYFVSI